MRGKREKQPPPASRHPHWQTRHGRCIFRVFLETALAGAWPLTLHTFGHACTGLLAPFTA